MATAVRRASALPGVVETAAYQAEVMRAQGAAMDDAGRSLLEEDLRSPCTEEIAVFRAFAREVAQGVEESMAAVSRQLGAVLDAEGDGVDGGW